MERKEKTGSLLLLIKAYIDQHYCDPGICLEQISTSLGVSSKHISRLFKEKAGRNLSDYLAQLRVHRAKQLLMETNLTVEEICGKVGIESRSTFMRIFKKYEGIAPGAWRDSHSADDSNEHEE
jgi:YesN/AraC family two-component response regulator